MYNKKGFTLVEILANIQKEDGVSSGYVGEIVLTFSDDLEEYEIQAVYEDRLNDTYGIIDVAEEVK